MTAVKLQALGLVVKESSGAVHKIVEELQAWCKRSKLELLLERSSAALLGLSADQVELNELGKSVQVVVVLGGDGTLLGVARATAAQGPYLIGVNFGTLGFLTEITPSEVIAALDRLKAGQARVVQRHLLHGHCLRDGKKVFESDAVNDLVIQKSTSSRLMDLNVFVDEQELMSIRGDGLIFSTPSGSTAYSLAAGGSIVHPQLDLTLITPICPHSLTNRPIILPGDCKVSVYLPAYQGSAYVTADGQNSFPLEPADEIRIERSQNKINLVKSVSHDYFSRLRSKLNWGIPNKGD